MVLTEWILIENQKTQGIIPMIILNQSYPLPDQLYIPTSQSENHQNQQNNYFSQNIMPDLLCVGLVIADYLQNGKQIKVYSTGTLISKNFILTSAQNVYNRRLKREYSNIKFIPHLSKMKHSGIYNVKRCYYDQKYKGNYGHQAYNFAFLDLVDDLSDKYGYLGVKINYAYQNQYLYINGYEYNKIKNNFYRKQIKSKATIKNKLLNYVDMNIKNLSGSPILILKNKVPFIIGIHVNGLKENYGIVLRKQIQEIINKRAKITFTNLSLGQSELGWQICEYIKIQKWKNLRELDLSYNDR